ncbi:FCD domain-containing protein [Tsukamurella tyrosinosolvens]|uniref:FCD domain-containing protein n=1 Tax=Tsukamurella tyrosinosolvens TaxID=57704 RepID=UPI001930E752|nr:FCD domain-containing protein [Tsukamurella tyrosinosolvens]
MRLASQRTDPSETQLIRKRMKRFEELDDERQRRLLDDVQIELAALSQSARLTREQMRLQAELSPLLRLVAATFPEDGKVQASHLRALIDAVEHGDAGGAVRVTEDMASHVIEALIRIQIEGDGHDAAARSAEGINE